MKSRLSLSLFILFLYLFITGCVATRQEIEDLRVDILKLEATLDKSRKGLKKEQTSLQGNQADLLHQMNQLSRNLEVLSAHLEENQNRMSLQIQRMDDLDRNLSNRLDLVSEMLSGSKLASDPLPSTLFNLALSDYNRNRYDPALKGFQTYLEKFKETERASDAQFYVGECYFAKGRHSKALKSYDKVLNHYSTSTIVPTAYLQKGQTLEKLGKKKEAIQVYKKVLKKYPFRKEVYAAKSRLAALQEADEN